ncbi:MAG: hypothetical protein NTW86_19800 [Candidatus Sumerlaeota bacterium]|nr:hypothetical protein [Candidatus Sumerlaeota bacterium]
MDRVEAALARQSSTMGALVLVGAFCLFNANRGHMNGGDTRGLVDLSWWVAQGNPPRLNGHPSYSGDGEWFGYWAHRTPDGHIATVYPPGVVLFAAPAFWAMKAFGLDDSASRAPLRAKLIASAMIAIACWCAWRILAALHGRLAALAGATALAAGSPWLSNLAQALWSQTPAVLCQALSCLCLLPRHPRSRNGMDEWPERIRVLVGGALAGWSAFCRPTFALWPVLYCVLARARSRRDLWLSLSGVLSAGVGGLALMKASTGSYMGEYGAKAVEQVGFTLAPGRALAAAAGLLASPSRGLLLFAPWTALVLVGLARLARGGNWRDPWLMAHAAFVVWLMAALSCFKGWYGGWDAGPRLQSDFLLSGLFVAGPLIGTLWFGIPWRWIPSAPM